jgi:hypothetical protein
MPGVDALFRQPVQWQEQPSGAGIFAHVAGDVGQLHRQPQIAGPGQDVGIPRPHQDAHHRADRPGHPSRVVKHAGKGLVLPPAGIPGQPFQQGIRQGAGHFEGFDDRGESPVAGRVPGASCIDQVEAITQTQHGLGLVGGAHLVHLVIGNAAERVKHEGGVANPGRQQA